MTTHIERIRYVTASFHELQGLRLVPLGLWLLVGALGQYEWTPWRDFIRGEWNSAGLAITAALIVLYLSVAQYYRARFGVTIRKDRSPREFGWVLVFGITVLAAIGIDSSFRPPISTVALVLAVTVGFAGIKKPRRYPYLILACAVAAAALSPLITGETYILSSLLVATAVGVSVVLVGLYDHLILVRELRKIRLAREADG